MKRFIVKIQIGEETIFDTTNKKKDITEWMKDFIETEVAGEIKIYEREGNSYHCVMKENTRKVGF